MPPIAVIILNWNGAKLLRRFLPSVIANTNPALADVIVADNGSNDDSLRLLETEFHSVKTIRFSENLGFAEGYNRAIAQCKDYRYTILLNSDVETPPGWVEPLYKAMEADPGTGACQPKILSAEHPEKFEYAGASGGFIDRNGYPYCRGRIFGTTETDNGQYDTPLPIFWATGAALMVRTGLYLKLGASTAYSSPTWRRLTFAGAYSLTATRLWPCRKAGSTISAEGASPPPTRVKPI